MPGQDFQVITVSFDDRDTPEIAPGKRTNYLKQITAALPAHGLALPHGRRGHHQGPVRLRGLQVQAPGGPVHPRRRHHLPVAPRARSPATCTASPTCPRTCRWPCRRRPGARPGPPSTSGCSSASATTPRGGRYVFSTTRIGATVIILLAAAIFVAVLILKGRRARAEVRGARMSTGMPPRPAQLPGGHRGPQGPHGLAHLHRPQAHRPALPRIP